MSSSDEDSDDSEAGDLFLDPTFDSDWADLDDDEQMQAAAVLELDEATWPDRYARDWPGWDDLTGAQREVLEDTFGISEDIWPPEPPAADVLETAWADMTAEQQAAAETLGFTAADWPACPGKVWPDFEDLDSDQEAAAGALGWDEYTWPPETAGPPLEHVYDEIYFDWKSDADGSNSPAVYMLPSAARPALTHPDLLGARRGQGRLRSSAPAVRFDGGRAHRQVPGTHRTGEGGGGHGRRAQPMPALSFCCTTPLTPASVSTGMERGCQPFQNTGMS